MPVLMKVFDETKTSKHLVLCNDVHDLLSKGKLFTVS